MLDSHGRGINCLSAGKQQCNPVSFFCLPNCSHSTDSEKSLFTALSVGFLLPYFCATFFLIFSEAFTVTENKSKFLTCCQTWALGFFLFFCFSLGPVTHYPILKMGTVLIYKKHMCILADLRPCRIHM